MSLLRLIATLVVAGVGLWLINQYIPMDKKIQAILNVVVVMVVLVWVLNAFGVLGSLSTTRIGK